MPQSLWVWNASFMRVVTCSFMYEVPLTKAHAVRLAHTRLYKLKYKQPGCQ